MSGTTSSTSFSDNFWSKSSKIKTAFINRKKESYDFIFSVDDTPDFHDPYSDLNLFLSQKIKQEMSHYGNCKKWSQKLQETLLDKITPEFQKKFPHYRLGVAALKKTWEKVAHFYSQIENQKEVITEEGKFNTHFFIKENFKQLSIYKPSSTLPPYHYAHQLAVKMSTCIATIDGTRPKLDQLTKMIWAVYRHLLPASSLPSGKNPYEECDITDKLIVKTILEISIRDPKMSQVELEYQVKESLLAFQEIPELTSSDKMTSTISSLLAEKLYPACAYHTAFSVEQKKAIHNFILRQTQLYKASSSSISFSDLTRRLLALYTLASGLPKHLSEEEIKLAIRATYPVLQKEKPAFAQSVYAFIAAESVLMKNDEYCKSVDHVVETIAAAYAETKFLPELKGKKNEILEIVFWKILNEQEGLLEKLIFKAGLQIEEKIASILIKNPTHSFASLVSLTVHAFKKMKEISVHKNWKEIERKIHLWTLQGDMLCRFLQIRTDSPVLNLIKEFWNEYVSHEQLISRVAQEYFKIYPQLTSYTSQVLVHIWTLYKYCWYALKSHKEESSFDRFLKWHRAALAPLKLSEEQIHTLLEEITSRCLPLVPYERP